jgi:hypothetical protein
MFAVPPFLFDVFVPVPPAVPAQFAPSDWSLTEVTSAPAQFTPADWSLEDTP